MNNGKMHPLREKVYLLCRALCLTKLDNIGKQIRFSCIERLLNDGRFIE